MQRVQVERHEGQHGPGAGHDHRGGLALSGRAPQAQSGERQGGERQAQSAHEARGEIGGHQRSSSPVAAEAKVSARYAAARAISAGRPT
ncbi:hypothetical protein [Nocardiopsis sp. CNR-923]|uniref:hypothetical protein n=1 Tax=Nocardiopsis sp. CNR-923 TaxID=1904965 RepID=UPI0021CD155F|nr:hypothetical protein [Nocardiopsis sp. CNR-923]